MSLKQIKLAPIMRKAQKKLSIEDFLSAKEQIERLQMELDKNALGAYFSKALSEDEFYFFKTFFKLLNDNLSTIDTFVPMCFQKFLNIDVERAKELTLTFGIHLVESHSGLLYLSWGKGVFDEE